MAADGELEYDITANSRGFEGTLGSANAMIGRLGGGIRGLLGPTAALVGISGGLGAIGKAIGGAAEIEQLGIAFEVMTGSAEKGKTLLEEIRAMGAATPYEFPALAKGGQTLLNFGIAADQVIPTLSMLGDIAAGDEQKLASLALVFGQIASTGRLMGGDLLQLINAGFNPLQVISERTGESMASLKDRMEKGAISIEEVKGAFVAATSEGGRFFGMMEKQAGTNNGLLSTLKDGINEIFVMFGKPINDALKPVLQGAIDDVKVLGTSLGAAIEMAQGAMANGTIGEALGLSLKIAAKEGINALIQGHIRQVKTLGDGVMVVVNEFSKAFSIGLLSAGQLFAGDMQASIIQMVNNVKTGFSWALSEATAIFEAGILYAVQQLKEQIGKIPFVGKGLEGFKSQSFGDLLNQRRDANGRPDMNINTKPVEEAADFIKEKLKGAGAAIENYWIEATKSGDFTGVAKDREEFAKLMQQAAPEAMATFLGAMKGAAAPIKDAAAKASEAIAKDVPAAISGPSEQESGDAPGSGRRPIRLLGLAESEANRKARMSQADKDKLAAGGSLLGAVTPSRSGLLPRAAADAAAGAPAVSPPRGRGRAAESPRASAESGLLSVLKEIAANTKPLQQLATA